MLKLFYFKKHENYDNQTLMNNIALIKVYFWFYLDDKVQVACLPDRNYSFDPLENRTFSSVGWGDFYYNLTNFLNITLLRNATNETQELIEYDWNGEKHFHNIFSGVSSLDVQFYLKMASLNLSLCEKIFPFNQSDSSSNISNSINLTFHDSSSQLCIGQLFTLNETKSWAGNFYHFFLFFSVF